MRQAAKYYVVSVKTQPFSPLDLSPALWLDASDTTTITESSGAVSEWRDKSGNARHVSQGTAASQPTTGSATLNGLNVVSFDGGDWLSVASFDMTGGQKFSVAVVYSATAIPGSGFDILLEQGQNLAGGFSFYRNRSNGFTSLAKNGSSGNTFYEATTTVGTAARIVIGTSDGTLSTNENTVWVDGNNAGTRPQNNDTNANNISATLFVGARNGTSLWLDGKIAEVVITKDALTTTQRESLQTYLATKWGL